MKLTGAHRSVLIAGIFFLGSALGYGGALVLINRADAALATLSAAIAEAELATSQADALSRFAKSLEDDRASIDARFVHADELVAFLAEVETVGRRSGVALSIDAVGEEKTLMPGASAPKKGKENADLYYPSIALSVSALGSWGDIMRFVGLVESMPYGTRVLKVHLEEDSSDIREWKALLQLSFAARSGTVETP